MLNLFVVVVSLPCLRQARRAELASKWYFLPEDVEKNIGSTLGSQSLEIGAPGQKNNLASLLFSLNPIRWIQRCRWKPPHRVIVSGAGGQTGQLAFRKLLSRPDKFEALGIVRTAESRIALIENGVPAENIVVADVTDADMVSSTIKDCDALIIATSATPLPIERRSDGTEDSNLVQSMFGFPNGQPEQVDWLGQKLQIDAAKSCGRRTHVVLLSSMGGTDSSNMLNAIGREDLPDGSTRGGNMLLWKRKAEQYLIGSGLPYTIVHPGGLTNEPGGQRELVLGVDDECKEGEQSIPRDDVATVLVQALLNPAYQRRSFDLRSRLSHDGAATTDFSALLKTLRGKNCNYKLGDIA